MDKKYFLFKHYYCPLCGYHTTAKDVQSAHFDNYLDRQDEGTVKEQVRAWQQFHKTSRSPLDEARYLTACPFCRDASDPCGFLDLKFCCGWSNEATSKQKKILFDNYKNTGYKNRFITKELARELIMALPTYDKSKRKKTFETLPKGAYVVKIMDAKEEANRNGKGSHLTISFDIAEGDYKDFYTNMYHQSTSEDKKWNRDAVYYLTIPADGCQQYVWDNWNTFFADLEDSNNGFVFGGGDPKQLRGKLIGGKFAIEQSEWNDNVYDHTRLRWTCVADDVRSGKPGKMPNDKLVTPSSSPAASSGIVPDSGDDWMKIPDGIEEDLPFA